MAWGPMSAFSLRVVFEKPGYFLNDPRMTVKLDGRTLHDGSMLSGFDRSEKVAPGHHVLETAIHVGLFSRKRRYVFVIGGEGHYREPAARFVARLEYSRLWGNFARKLTLERA
jgi:hypothetical protein